MRTEEPRAIHLADYKAPDFHIETVRLDFSLEPEATRVTATTHIVRKTADAPLVLQGENLELMSLALDGRVLDSSEYSVDAKSLTIASVPDRFILTTVTQIAPAKNTALEGLYQSGGM